MSEALEQARELERVTRRFYDAALDAANRLPPEDRAELLAELRTESQPRRTHE